ncbi:cobalt ABC transporter permease [Terasakiella pusilla]|uniref:cobalt ABC transporter permease n=1 Tax=Terasakiella pusilla TaxID=64973 RepID=UPI003AA9BE63
MPKFYITAFFALLLMTGQALAHKVVGSGWTDGADIEGEVGFSNGDMAKKGTVVEVFDADDNKIGETTVTEDGLFRFTPTQAVAHTFVANLGAGHVARFTMGVDELPKMTATQTPTPASTPQPGTDTAGQVTAIAPAFDPTDLQKMIAKAVRQEVQPLRKEIASYKEKNNMQAILGGIGYIFGLTGVVFYIMARRKEKAAV